MIKIEPMGTVKSAVSTPVKAISILLVAAMSISLMGLAAACSAKPESAAGIPPIVVDSTKIIEILSDEADSKILYADTTANLVTATETNEKPRPLFIGDGGNGDLTRASGKAVPVAIFMRDMTAFSDYEADESTTQQAGYKPQTAAFNLLSSVTVAAADTKTYPYQDWDKFQQDFYDELQKLGCVGNTPFEYMNGVSSTRSGQVTEDLSHNGSNYFVGQLQGGASTRENLALFEGKMMLNITGAQLAKAWWASPGHQDTLRLGGAYGLGISEGVNEYGEPQLFFAYNTVIPFSGDLASVLPKSDKPTWFDKPEEPVAESETEEPAKESIVEEPETVEIDPGGVANDLDDAIDHLVPPTEPDEAAGGDKIIDDPDTPKTGIGGWPEEQPIIIDKDLAANLPISPDVENDIAVGGDTFQKPVDSDEDGWADEIQLVKTDPDALEVPVSIGFGDIRIYISPDWWQDIGSQVSALISSGDFDGALNLINRARGHVVEVAPPPAEGGDPLTEVENSANEAKVEAEAAAAAAAAAPSNNAGTGGGGGGTFNNSGNSNGGGNATPPPASDGEVFDPGRDYATW